MGVLWNAEDADGVRAGACNVDVGYVSGLPLVASECLDAVVVRDFAAEADIASAAVT